MTALVDRQVAGDLPRHPDGRPPRRSGSWLRALALLSGTASIVGALLLPFAPVEVDGPVVTWPLVSTAPESTLLPLEAGTPLGMDVEFTCGVASAAAAPGGERVLLATARPGRAGPAGGLRLVVDGPTLTAFLGADVVFRDVVPAGTCRYRIDTEVDQTGGTRLGYHRDGLRLGTSALPTVDALITDLTALPGPDLTVTVRVDDRYDGSPGPVKVALLVGLALSTCVAVGCLLAGRRRRPRRVRRPRRFRVSPADVVVGAVLVAWLFLAPMTHDDGWMYAMALNERHSGYFGNYYMYFNNSYVPFTWLLRIYAWWSEVGVTPVLMRVPSLAFAVITWAAVRGTLGRTTRRRVFVTALLFLAWWLPFGLGTRQEASVAACLAVTVYAVTAARRRQRPAYLGLAVGAAALGLIAHPAGIIGVLPLLLAGPASVRLIRRTSRTVLDGIATTVCVLACAAVAGVAGFADGSLADFLRGKSSFGDADSADGAGAGALLTEVDRYRSLLGDASIGNYAIRTPVLLLLLVLPFFLLLCAHARRRRRPLPRTLWLTGWTCALGLGLLVLTPSKWTWHFGAFAGIATIFLSCWAATAPRLATGLLSDRRGLLLGTGPVALALTAGWVVLSGQGHNWWADNLMPGVPRGGQPLLPAAAAVVAVVAVTAVGLWVWRRRGLRASVPTAGLLVGCLLVGELAFLVGGFGVAVARTWDTWSPWADAVQDPLAHGCGEGRVVSIADPATAVGVPVWSGEPVVDRFAPDLRPTDGPPPGPATAQVWGSLPASPEAPARLRTPWLRLPADLSAGHQLMTTVSGSTGNGNVLTAEFGTPAAAAPDGVRVVATGHLDSPEDSGSWRDVSISDGGALPAGVTAFRLTATATHDRLLLAMPTVRRMVPVADALPRDGRTLVDWQLTWLYPCLGQPPIGDGIVSPVSYVVAFGFGPDGSRFSPTNGGTWTAEIGGMLGSQVRSSTVTRLYTVHDTEPGYPMRTVYRLTQPYADHAYLLQRTSSTSPGWRTPG